ncbi:MAG TPA: hypothetical protein PLL75_08070 [Candidatus Omnitrophota bacterium]|nr:hypothetical protein [Candidatus Omnitrophota bacterium]HPS37663.1 hypothetical protein [Candidatus Omnitrophota bacterium]
MKKSGKQNKKGSVILSASRVAGQAKDLVLRFFGFCPQNDGWAGAPQKAVGA